MNARLPIVRLALASIASRRSSAFLTCSAVALSVFLVLGIQQLRDSTRQSFASTIAGTDLLVGPRTSGVNLLLYAVFRIGQPTNNVSWESYRRYAGAPGIAWSIPLSLGDSYHGFAVVGTTDAYFRHFRYGADRPLQFVAGGSFGQAGEAVLGAAAAADLGHRVGDEIVLSHGVGGTSFLQHEERPVRITGVLAATGTVADRAVYVGLDTLELLHATAVPSFGTPPAGRESGAGAEGGVHGHDPEEITAFLLGLESRVQVLRLQRAINESADEPLTAVIPAVALYELWSVIGIAENALLAVGVLAVLTGLVGMLVAILGTLNERRREMAILRSVGARPHQVFALLIAEAGLLAGGGAVLGVMLEMTVLGALRSPIQTRTGIVLEDLWPGATEAVVVTMVIATGLVLGALPAWRAYRNSLADGMIIRL